MQGVVKLEPSNIMTTVLAPFLILVEAKQYFLQAPSIFNKYHEPIHLHTISTGAIKV